MCTYQRKPDSFRIMMGTTSTRTSFLCSSVLMILLFCLMQMYKGWLCSSQLHTILGGYLASLLFIFLLTAVGNLETMIFGSRFNTKLFPEVALCLIAAVVSAGLVHRVCSTTCFIFSLIGLYFINRQAKRAVPSTSGIGPIKKKK